MSSAVERILVGSDAGRIAGAVAQVAGGTLAEIEGSLPRALAGDRRQVHLYVDAYRRLADGILGAVGEARPDLIAVDRRSGSAIVVEFKASGGRPAPALWLRTALEQGAMSAPFTDWIGRMGVGPGAGVAFVALMRDALPGVQPLPASAERRFPDWKLDERDVLRFYRAVVDELERGEMPLERLQAVLGLSRTELAALFGIRRQALDHWQASGVPAERQEKLATVEEVADLLAAKLKDDRIPGVVRRPSSAYGGRSALDAIAGDDQELVLAELRDAFDWAAAA
jgi:hypothetical protein